jgi:DNA repair protein SbcC/Rad50
MVIKISKLSLINFKGIRSLEIDFNHVTNIFGDNAKGKTTVFDAFLWLFFGKDSTDRKDFEIKTLDGAGKTIEKLEHEVSAIIYADDQRIEIKRILREKWEKKRGTQLQVFTGNETLYYWNDVPMQQKEYQAKINALVDEGVFKLITNTQYFNSMPWQNRRNELMKIAGSVTNEDVLSSVMNADNKEGLTALVKELNSGKSLAEYKAQISAKKKKIKDDLEAIPTRIDECSRSTPEPSDFAGLRKQIEQKQQEINAIDDQIQDAVKQQEAVNKAAMERNNQIHQLKSKLQNLEHDASNSFADQRRQRESEILNLRRNITNLAEKRDSLISESNTLARTIETKRTQKAGLAIKWEQTNSKELSFTDGQFECPACHRPLEAHDIESKKTELLESFNTDKANQLSEIEASGSRLKDEILSAEKRVEEITALVSDIESEGKKLQDLLQQKVAPSEQPWLAEALEITKFLDSSEAYQAVKKELAELESVATSPTPAPVNTELREKKQAIQSEINELNIRLADEELIKKAKARIDELSDEESRLAQQLANLEGTEFLIEKFNRVKIDTIQSRINGMFKMVKFKMFDMQINGGEFECCEALIHGVPFSDANNAAKINAGLDIINTLCKHYNVYAPIFIDNRESVNDLIDCDSQIVNLIVSRDEKLRVA